MNGDTTRNSCETMKSAKHDHFDFSTISPRKLTKQELDNLYIKLVHVNQEMHYKLHQQEVKIHFLTDKLQKLVAVRRNYATTEITNLRKKNHTLAEKVRQLSQRIGNDQLRQTYPYHSADEICPVNRRPGHMSSRNSSKTKIKFETAEEVNTSEDINQLQDSYNKDTNDNKTEAESKHSNKACNAKECQSRLNELSQKVDKLQEELSQAHSKLSEQTASYKLDEEALRARYDRESCSVKRELVTAKDKLRGARLEISELATNLSIERAKVCELETRVRAARITAKVTETIERHLLSKAEKAAEVLKLNSTETIENKSAPNEHNLTSTQTQVESSNDSGFNDLRSQEQEKVNRELMLRIADLQTQLVELQQLIIQKDCASNISIKDKESAVKTAEILNDEINANHHAKDDLENQTMVEDEFYDINFREDFDVKSEEKSSINDDEIVRREDRKDNEHLSQNERLNTPNKVFNLAPQCASTPILVQETNNSIGNSEEISKTSSSGLERDDSTKPFVQSVEGNSPKHQTKNHNNTEFDLDRDGFWSGQNESYFIPLSEQPKQYIKESLQIGKKKLFNKNTANNKDKLPLATTENLSIPIASDQAIETKVTNKFSDLSYKHKQEINQDKAKQHNESEIPITDEKQALAPHQNQSRKNNASNDKQTRLHNTGFKETKTHPKKLNSLDRADMESAQPQQGYNEEANFHINNEIPRRPSLSKTYSIYYSRGDRMATLVGGEEKDRGEELVSRSRTNSPDNTDQEISCMSDLPAEDNVPKIPSYGRPRSPGECKHSTSTASTEPSSTTDYHSLSEGELPIIGWSGRKSADMDSGRTEAKPYFIQHGRGQELQSERENHRRDQPSTSRYAEESPVTIVGESEMVECKKCNTFLKKRYLNNHLRSNIHKNNALKTHHHFSNVTLIDTAFGMRIHTYRITSIANGSELETIESFITSLNATISSLLNDSINQEKTLKVNFILHAHFVQQTKDINNTFSFQSPNHIICKSDNIQLFIETLKNYLSIRVSEFEKKDSGWSLKNILSIDMNINKFNPLRGSSYIELPQDIRVKKAVINVKNGDVQCLKWALLSALYPVTKNVDRVNSYSKYEHKLNFEGISFPVKLSDLHKVERLNNLSINVFGIEYNAISKRHEVIGPLYFSKSPKPNHTNLLYITNGSTGHYCYIKNLSRLVSQQLTSRNGRLYICDGCLIYFNTQDALSEHKTRDCTQIRSDLPDPNTFRKTLFGETVSNDKLFFEKFERKQTVPFVIYADFESLLKPINSCSNDPNQSSTTNVQRHDVYSFGYYLKCSYDNNLSKYVTYSGEDCAQVFMTKLHEDLKIISRKNSFQKCPLPLTEKDKETIHQTTKCFICEKDITAEKYIDHDWHSGAFQGVSHETCSDKFHYIPFVPVILHNLSNYDSHFIVHALNFAEGEIQIIPQNKEKYISFSKVLKVDDKFISLRFIDSFKFQSKSLDSLANDLTDEQFYQLKREFPHENDFQLLKRKGVYPYEFMTSFDSLSSPTLPSIENFYSSLTGTNITSEDYEHAIKVWSHFNCQSMGDYSDIYLKTDVLLLCDIFENFRSVCKNTYDLDPAHYYTAPGLSWDSMLKYTGVKLELLTDFDKIAFIKSGIRGGISQCSNRYAKANNPYMKEYDNKDPTSYLTYLDANNLYGWAMSQYLPTSDFEWDLTNVDFNVPITSDIGYILEVDLEYPDNLHNAHSDFPLCPENICLGETKESKLVPNLNNKEKYVIHYRNLIQCLEKGMKLKKVHRVLKFNQSAWLKKYIDLNTQLRTLATSEFEKDFYKLMNNSVLGKTMENNEKRVNVKLITHWENRGKTQGASSLIARPEFHSLSVFSENLVAVQLKKMKLFYNKPIYLGFCILDLSKILMYDFHYNYMKKKFQNLKLLYTDTDSLVYQIFCNDYYAEIKSDLTDHFDTSDYPQDNVYDFPLVNKKKLGFFKDENNGNIFTEFVGLRSKMYAIKVDSKIITKAKGVNKCVTKRLKLENYKSCLFAKNIQLAEMYRFRSIKHVVFTQRINKICLSYNDTKRYIMPNSTDTLAWGHYKLR